MRTAHPNTPPIFSALPAESAASQSASDSPDDIPSRLVMLT
jgi:hypothetical protein